VTTKDDIQVGCCAGVYAEAKLHSGAALDDKQVATVVVADIVEHGADDAYSYKVYDPLWELSDIGGVSLKQPLKLFGTSGAFVHDGIKSA